MPNWIRNKVTFDGSVKDIEIMLESIKTVLDNETLYIDFQKIMPMPESLLISSGTNNDTGVSLINHLNGDSTDLKGMLNYPWVKKENINSVDELFEYFQNKEDYQNLIELGQKSIDNIKNYGHKDWYSWSCENWGTKWNSSDSNIDDNQTLWFDTAWSTPYPVLLELSSKFPDIEFTIEFADEDIGSNTGKYVMKSGCEINFETYDGIQACDIWGYDPQDFFPDIYRDNQINKILDQDTGNKNI